MNITLSLQEAYKLSKLTKEEILEFLNTKAEKVVRKKERKELHREANRQNLLQQALVRKGKLRVQAEEYREKLIKDQTEAEKVFKILLKDWGIKFEFQKIFFINDNKFYIPDFYLPELNLIIELDGAHHFTKEGKKKDKIRTTDLLAIGINKVIRFPNSVVFNSSLENREQMEKSIKKIKKPIKSKK